MAASTLSTLGMGLDPRCEVFVRGDRVLRAIRPAYATFYRDLLETPVIQELQAAGLLIGTKLSSEQIEGYPLVLEHPRLWPLSFPFEWPPTLFQIASAAVLELNARLMRHGLCTVDGHPWNILFNGTKPVFVDFTSIIPLPKDGLWAEGLEFYRTSMSGLRLMQKGYATAARAMLREVRKGPDATLANSVVLHGQRFDRLPRGVRELRKGAAVIGHYAGKLFRRAKTGAHAAMTADGVKDLLQEVKSMPVSPETEMWSNYYDGRSDVGFYDGTKASLDELIAKSPKYAAVARILERLRPATVLDIACNRGPYSQMAAGLGAKVVGVDTDEAALDAMVRDTQRLGTTVTPLWCNIVTPAEAIGFRRRPFPHVSERFHSEFVLCLALVHHLVLKGFRLSFAHVAEMLADFTAKDLLVEFVPVEDRAVSDYVATRDAAFRESIADYTLENFKAALSAHFATIEEIPSFPETRVLLLCSRHG
jgi:SAM-dependent methyltransferase